MKRAACQFFIFLGSKVASQLPEDGERGDLGLAKGYICTMCLWKNSKGKGGREREREKKKWRKSGKAGLDQLNDSTVLGVMEKALWGNIQYARVSSCMQSLQWCLSLSRSLFVYLLWNVPSPPTRTHTHTHTPTSPCLSFCLCESVLWGDSFAMEELFCCAVRIDWIWIDGGMIQRED